MGIVSIILNVFNRLGGKCVVNEEMGYIGRIVNWVRKDDLNKFIFSMLCFWSLDDSYIMIFSE